MARFIPRGLGWNRDLPDLRDFSPSHPHVEALLKPIKLPGGAGSRPPRVDWREYCPPIENQAGLNAGPAHACLAQLQYFERRSFGNHLEPSRLFLYKMKRQMMQCTGDAGASLRATLKAMLRFGIPPETYWPYDPATFDCEPDPFLFAFSEDLKSLRYLRLDPRGASGAMALENVKLFLAAGLPCVLGFPVYSSLSQQPDIPFPTLFDFLRGGQAVMAVGYDDTRAIRSTRGALLIRNSWGADWGDGGYGWLPDAYVKEGWAADCWTFVKQQWLASGEFTALG